MKTDPFVITNGTKQGRVFAPFLFVLYLSVMFEKVFQNLSSLVLMLSFVQVEVFTNVFNAKTAVGS